ncbi:MAG: OmpH family outer membrane protein [Prevotellaceae bacterium]|nr:OmpH family outer membrane protein [Prevotella sp.]MDD7258015.1 OmpH family outer membrane protein [Prevotellaceae bacterium]MDY6130521.1 OmpH family outer membrane protein [Prevotella sp.]
MRRILISILLCALPFLAGAQIRFGYLSYSEAFRAMPEYAVAQRNLSELRAQYDAEMKRAETEFNKKYEDFLEGQRSFAEAIRRKRQSELQEMMQKNVAFKQKAQQLLEAAERDAFFPLKEKLNSLLVRMGKERGYAFILNTDNNACPYVSNEMGENITADVRQALAAE